METVDQIIDRTIGLEGRYSNNPSDPGGETMWGVTRRTALSVGYNGSMRDMPRASAVAIYRKLYYENPGFNLIGDVSPVIAAELFDTGVNIGTSLPARWLQEWLNVLNDLGTLYSDIIVDGRIGPATVTALRGLIQKRGKDEAETVILRGLNADQACRYKALCLQKESFETFAWGWLRARVSM